MEKLVPPQQRNTLRAHPLAFWFAFGVMLSGLIALLHPDSATGVQTTLDPWQRYIFNFDYAVGGALVLLGLTSGRSRVEAAGMMLLAAGFATYYAVVVGLTGGAYAWQGGFLIAICIGAAHRALTLIQCGYERVHFAKEEEEEARELEELIERTRNGD
jgi:hypothetical protein